VNPETSKADWQFSLGALDTGTLNAIPALAGSISTTLDDMTESLIVDCVEPLEGLDGVPIGDVFTLRDAAFKLADWREVLEAEKNLLVGIFQSVMVPAVSVASGNGKPSNTTGGPDGSPNSSTQGIGATPKSSNSQP